MPTSYSVLVSFARVLVDIMLLHFVPFAPPQLRGLVYSIAARDRANHSVLRSMYQQADDATERSRLLNACAIAPIEDVTESEAAIVNEILDWAIPEVQPQQPIVKPQDAFNTICTAASSSIHAQKLAWQWLQSRWKRVVSLYGSGQFLLAAIMARSFGRFADEATADEMEKFFAANPVDSAKRSMAQSVEGVRARASRWSTIEPVVQAFFASKE